MRLARNAYFAVGQAALGLSPRASEVEWRASEVEWRASEVKWRAV